MNPLRRPSIGGPPVGSDGANESAVLRFGHMMILLGVVNPPFWGSVVRGINRGTIIACVVFSGLMMVFGVVLTLVGRFQIARNVKNTPGWKGRSHERGQ
mgnify:CR=1 FL=1